MDLVSVWFPSRGGCRPNLGQAMVEPNDSGVHVRGLLPLFLALHGDWFPDPLPAFKDRLCLRETHASQ